MSLQRTNRPYSLPPTNVEIHNDYTGMDRGLFLSRDPSPKYMRVVEAEWVSYGPSSAPGILRFRLGMYNAKPTTAAQYDNYTPVKAKGNDEWFDVATSGPIHSPLLVEYWAKFIYYNYYLDKTDSEIQSVMEDTNLVNDIKSVGAAFVESIVPSFKEFEVTAKYIVSTGLPLSLTSMSAKVTPKVGDPKTVNLRQAVTNDRTFDPVIAASKLM